MTITDAPPCLPHPQCSHELTKVDKSAFFALIDQIPNSFITLLGVLVAFFSLIIVIYIFNSNRQERNFEREINIKLFWFQELFLNEYILYLAKFFDRVTNISKTFVSTPLSAASFNTCVNGFEKQYRFILNQIEISPIGIFQDLFENIEKSLINFQDKYFEFVGNIYVLHIKNSTSEINGELIELIQTNKKHIYSIIYDSHSEILIKSSRLTEFINSVKKFFE